MNLTEAQKPITKLETIGYGFGGLANNLISMTVSSYIIFFLTDVAGISSGIAGVIFVIARIVDAMCDPILGALSDKTVSRWGRYRPYMIFGSLFAALSFILLFTTVNFGTIGNNIYYLIVYCMWSVGFTLTVAPYQSIVSVITQDKQRRNWLITSGKLVSIPAGLVVANMFRIVGKLGNDAAAWQKMAFILGICIVASLLICAKSTKRFDTKEAAILATTRTTGEKYTLKDRLKAVSSNKALFMLIIAFSTNTFASASVNSVQSYYAKYVIMDMSFISTVGNYATLLTIPAFLLVPLLTKYFAKRDIFKVATVLHVLFPIALLVLNSKEHLNIITALFVLSNVTSLVANVSAFMMLPDCVDFGQKTTGIMSAGLITTTFTFGNKIGTALGGLAASTAMQTAGYNPNTEQTAFVLTMIILCMSVPTIISDIASYVSMIKYPIDERKLKVDSAEVQPCTESGVL